MLRSASRIFFQSLIQSFPEIERILLTQPPEMFQNFLMGQVSHLPLTQEYSRE